MLSWNELCTEWSKPLLPGVGMQGVVTEDGHRSQKVRLSLDDSRPVRGMAHTAS